MLMTFLETSIKFDRVLFITIYYYDKIFIFLSFFISFDCY